MLMGAALVVLNMMGFPVMNLFRFMTGKRMGTRPASFDTRILKRRRTVVPSDATELERGDHLGIG